MATRSVGLRATSAYVDNPGCGREPMGEEPQEIARPSAFAILLDKDSFASLCATTLGRSSGCVHGDRRNKRSTSRSSNFPRGEDPQDPRQCRGCSCAVRFLFSCHRAPRKPAGGNLKFGESPVFAQKVRSRLAAVLPVPR